MPAESSSNATAAHAWRLFRDVICGPRTGPLHEVVMLRRRADGAWEVMGEDQRIAAIRAEAAFVRERVEKALGEVEACCELLLAQSDLEEAQAELAKLRHQLGGSHG